MEHWLRAPVRILGPHFTVCIPLLSVMRGQCNARHSQLHGFTALWQVPNYVKDLTGVDTWKWNGWELTLWPVDRWCYTLTTVPDESEQMERDNPRWLLPDAALLGKAAVKRCTCIYMRACELAVNLGDNFRWRLMLSAAKSFPLC